MNDENFLAKIKSVFSSKYYRNGLVKLAKNGKRHSDLKSDESFAVAIVGGLVLVAQPCNCERFLS